MTGRTRGVTKNHMGPRQRHLSVHHPASSAPAPPNLTPLLQKPASFPCSPSPTSCPLDGSPDGWTTLPTSGRKAPPWTKAPPQILNSRPSRLVCNYQPLGTDSNRWTGVPTGGRKSPPRSRGKHSAFPFRNTSSREPLRSDRFHEILHIELGRIEFGTL